MHPWLVWEFESVSASETSVNFCETASCSISQDSHLPDACTSVQYGIQTRGYCYMRRNIQVLVSTVLISAFQKVKTYCAVSWLRRLVAGLSPRRPGFTPEPVHVGFVALGQVLLLISSVFPCQYHSTVTLHTSISPWELTISTLLAAVQRHSLAPSTWTTTTTVTHHKKLRQS
jgi:hypothetical protein